MNLSFDGRGALNQQLARALRSAILDGQLIAGSRLPATRALADSLRVSRNTVLAAYELLCAEQLAVARAGSGTRVARSAGGARQSAERRPSSRPSRYAARLRELKLPGGEIAYRYSLQYGEPLLNPRLFNCWRGKLAAAAVRTDPGYPAPAGLPALRVAICEHLKRRRGFLCAPDDVLIVSGTRQALALVARVALDEDDLAVVEDPHSPLAVQSLRAHGARVVSVATDREGLSTAQLPQEPARLIHVTPSHQFPSGVAMSLARRLDLLRQAELAGAWIFEDDYDGEFHYGARPIAALRALDGGERVIYAGTFSKSIFPALRLGYIVAPRGLRDDLCAAKRVEDGGCPAIEQTALAVFMQSGHFDKHLRWSAAELKRRLRVLCEGLRHFCGEHIVVSEPPAGMHLVGWLPRFSESQFARLLSLSASRGLELLPVGPYYDVAPPCPGLLLGFAGLSCNEIRSATDLLGRTLRESVQAKGASGDRPVSSSAAKASQRVLG